jgi:DNA-binding beta-propeller fold protein YncE
MNWGRTMPGTRARIAMCAVALAAGGAALPALGAGLPGTSPSLSEPLPGAGRLPNGWKLDPAGTQVLTNRATTGVWISPTGSDIYATTSGIFEEAVVHVDGSTLIPTPTLVSDTYQGVAGDSAGNVWVSGGSADRVWQFKAAGPALVDARQAGAVPDTPNRGIAVTGYPGNMLLEGSKLYVAGNISVPSKVAAAASGGTPCPSSSSICSVVNVVDVSNPDAASPAVHAIPVGRDAYGLAYRPPGAPSGPATLYVTNWADQTDPARGGGNGTVSVVKVNPDGTGSEVQAVAVGLEPTGVALSPDGTTLVVTNAGSDTVSVLGVDPGTGGLTVRETLPVLGAGVPLGASPDSVQFSPDGTLAFVALSGIDAVEVFSVSGGELSAIGQKIANTRFDGQRISDLNVSGTFIPTGWYPDALAVGKAPAGAERLVVANLRGEGAGPGYYGQTEPLVGSSTEGSLSVIDLPKSTAAGAWNAWTKRVVEDDQLAPLWDSSLADPANNPCLAAPLPDGTSVSSGVICGVHNGKIPSGSLHVVIIEAENKTFDSYFGDTGSVLKNANADPQWTEYGAAVTTNQHNLAETYNVDDNFWNEGAEASTLGHSWLSGAYTTLDRELTWGPDYSQNLRGQRSNGQYAAGSPLSLSGPTWADVNAQESVMLSPRQLLIDEAQQAGLGVRLFGTDTRPGSPAVAAGDQVPQALWGESGSDVSTDLAWPDVDRAAMFLHGKTVSHAWDVLETGVPPAQYGKTIQFNPADQQSFTLDGWTASYHSCMAGSGATDVTCQSKMPNLVYMQLPENHTYDVSNVFNPQDPTPQSMVADNDYAIGEIVQGLSQSPFWSHTLVMITEDDNQFTGDHVDIHRTFLLSAGGLARALGSQGKVATQVGSFASVDKTAEALLGLSPMTLFDARAVPLQQVVADSVGSNQGTYTAVYPPTPFLSGRVPGQ